MNSKTNWLKERKWGVFVHYLYHEYNKPSVKNDFEPARYSIHEDFTAGEETEFMKFYPNERFVDGAQWHILSFLGQPSADAGVCGKCGWSRVGSKYSGDELRDYVTAVNKKGGVVSVDIAVFDNGTFDKGQIEVLKALKNINR